METRATQQTFLKIHPPLPFQWDETLARRISNMLCPPVVAVMGYALITLFSNEAYGWLWMTAIIIITIGFPTSYVVLQVKRGGISDFHIPVRSQRIRPLIFTSLCAIATLTVLWFLEAPVFFIKLLLISIALIAVMLIITQFWKISGHSMAISGMVVIVVHLLGASVLPMLILMPLVAWARIRLRRHTLAQTIAGMVLGIIWADILIWWVL